MLCIWQGCSSTPEKILCTPGYAYPRLKPPELSNSFETKHIRLFARYSITYYHLKGISFNILSLYQLHERKVNSNISSQVLNSTNDIKIITIHKRLHLKISNIFSHIYIKFLAIFQFFQCPAKSFSSFNISNLIGNIASVVQKICTQIMIYRYRMMGISKLGSRATWFSKRYDSRSRKFNDL